MNEKHWNDQLHRLLLTQNDVYICFMYHSYSCCNHVWQWPPVQSPLFTFYMTGMHANTQTLAQYKWYSNHWIWINKLPPSAHIYFCRSYIHEQYTYSFYIAFRLNVCFSPSVDHNSQCVITYSLLMNFSSVSQSDHTKHSTSFRCGDPTDSNQRIHQFVVFGISLFLFFHFLLSVLLVYKCIRIMYKY